MRNSEFFILIYPAVFLGAFFCVAASTSADEVLLSNGDVIHGTVIEQTQDSITLEHPNLGTFQIPMQQIQSFSTSPKDTSVVQAPSATEPSQETDDELPEGYGIMPSFDRLNNWASAMKQRGYNLSVNLSLNGSWGETDEQSLRAGVKLGRETEETRMKTDLTYYNKTSKSETTDNKLSAGYRKDWLVPLSQWFYFYEGRYDFDEFESWKHRASGHGGAGYNLLDTNRWKLALRTGPGARKEWGSENNEVRFEGIAGMDFEWRFSKRQTLTGYTAYYPVLTNFSDYRTRSGLNWRFFMSRELDLSFQIGLEHEFQNIVDPGAYKNNTRLYMGIEHVF